MLKRISLAFPQIGFAEIGLILALLVLTSQLGVALFDYAHHAQAALSFLYPLDYGEGPILDQALRLAHSENIYHNDFATPPYTLSAYPPLFQLIQAPFTQLFGPAFWYGRAISILSALLAALFIALIVQTLTDSWMAAIIAGPALLAFPHILQGSVFDQVDTLALAFSLAGLFAIIRWPDRRTGVILSATLLLAAIYTKQTYALVAPLTALLWLAQGKYYRSALGLAVLLIGSGLGVFFLLNLSTHGGFYLNLAAAARISFDPRNLVANGIEAFFQAPYLAIGIILFVGMERFGDHTRSWTLVTPYTILAALSVILENKGGSVDVNLYEPAASMCLALGAIIAWAGSNNWFKAVLVLIMAFQLGDMVGLSREDYAPFVLSKTQQTRDIQQLADIVRNAPGPVLTDEYMGLIPLMGQRIYFQPYEFSALSQAGLWDPSALIASIQHREFPAIMLYLAPTNALIIVQRWEKPIRDAIWPNYQSSATLADVWVYVPKKETISSDLTPVAWTLRKGGVHSIRDKKH